MISWCYVINWLVTRKSILSLLQSTVWLLCYFSWSQQLVFVTSQFVLLKQKYKWKSRGRGNIIEPWAELISRIFHMWYFSIKTAKTIHTKLNLRKVEWEQKHAVSKSHQSILNCILRLCSLKIWKFKVSFLWRSS